MKQKNKRTAIILAVAPAVGGFLTCGFLFILSGIHWLYLGKEYAQKGYVYMLASMFSAIMAFTFCWLILPLGMFLVPPAMALYSAIEGYRLWQLPQREFDALYNDIYGATPLLVAEETTNAEG